MLEHFVYHMPDFENPQSLEETLDDLSREGWELCGITVNGAAVFKRELRIPSDNLTKMRERQHLTEIVASRKKKELDTSRSPNKSKAKQEE